MSPKLQLRETYKVITTQNKKIIVNSYVDENNQHYISHSDALGNKIIIKSYETTLTSEPPLNELITYLESCQITANDIYLVTPNNPDGELLCSRVDEKQNQLISKLLELEEPIKPCTLPI